MKLNYEDTICAIATPPGQGAISVIRLSGPKAFEICDSFFAPARNQTRISNAEGYTIHFGKIRNDQAVVDEVLVSVFRAPHSYTGEDAVEISCHGSVYIQQKIVELLIEGGARHAEAGEFTLRAFMNGKFDLSQAEAVADLIASSSGGAHKLALEQMRGGYSKKIKELRQKLVDFTSLIELELDFSEEDVEFANRKELLDLLGELDMELEKMVSSFQLGNVIKKGIPVTIIGRPNVGKSTLLNAILNEDRAIVSEIPGTTRDTVEDVVNLESQMFRFIDTAGLRHASDKVENIGIERTYEKIRQASIILYVFDISKISLEDVKEELGEFRRHHYPDEGIEGKKRIFIPIANKTDMLEETPQGFKDLTEMGCIFVSAKRKENINLILERLVGSVQDLNMEDRTIVSNIRHFEALSKAKASLESVIAGFTQGISTDLLTVDIRDALHHLGEITGEITTDEILGNIFSRFCIGK